MDRGRTVFAPAYRADRIYTAFLDGPRADPCLPLGPQRVHADPLQGPRSRIHHQHRFFALPQCDPAGGSDRSGQHATAPDVPGRREHLVLGARDMNRMTTVLGMALGVGVAIGACDWLSTEPLGTLTD